MKNTVLALVALIFIVPTAHAQNSYASQQCAFSDAPVFYDDLQKDKQVYREMCRVMALELGLYDSYQVHFLETAGPNGQSIAVIKSNNLDQVIAVFTRSQDGLVDFQVISH